MKKKVHNDSFVSKRTYIRKNRSHHRTIKPVLLLGSLLMIFLLTGCMPSIESNIKETELYVTSPDYPHIFTLSEVELEVEFKDNTTRVINPQTGEPYFYMVDKENFYFMTGNRENLRIIHAQDDRIQFGFFPDEPRLADHPNVDVIVMPIEEIIKKTKQAKILLEFINTTEKKQMGLVEYDLTEGGYGK